MTEGQHEKRQDQIPEIEKEKGWKAGQGPGGDAQPQNEGGGFVRSTLRLSWVSGQKFFARSMVVKSDFERF
jgi:hypothetical protein